MIALYILGSAALMLYVLWLYYLAVMNLQREHKRDPLTGATLYAGYAVFWPGYVLDALVNVTLMTVIMLEFPREWLVTARLIRHMDGEGYRGRIARWFCRTLLDRFDPAGCHCKK